jgi:hypothetical protein
MVWPIVIWPVILGEPQEFSSMLGVAVQPVKLDAALTEWAG